ncbi:MAG: Non-heme bromoperoxidase BPO-A2 [Chlamydiae bacterium]|nr:Non-heme bromoperoxidase BPO-A2 [Chlamydiota bacterium]
MSHFKNNGIELYYSEKGKGEPLILLPGFAQHSGIWKDWVSHLSSTFRTITIDNRGSGQSSCPTGPYKMEDFARDTVAPYG